MINRDPKCVFVAGDVGRATVVASWLENQGIPAQVMDEMTLGGLDGLSGWLGISARGMEVWVLREDLVDHARELLAEHEDIQSDILARKAAMGPVSVRCEDCGTVNVFPGDRRGMLEDCPRCGGCLDVPEEGGDVHPAACAQGANALEPVSQMSTQQPWSWWQIVQKTIIYACALLLMLVLCLPVLAVIVDILSRWWKF